MKLPVFHHTSHSDLLDVFSMMNSVLLHLVCPILSLLIITCSFLFVPLLLTISALFGIECRCCFAALLVPVLIYFPPHYTMPL